VKTAMVDAGLGGENEQRRYARAGPVPAQEWGKARRASEFDGSRRGGPWCRRCRSGSRCAGGVAGLHLVLGMEPTLGCTVMLWV
jgi:hypothetical protein